MSNNTDWIKLHRSILQSNVFQDAEVLKVWLWILCKANWSDTDTIIGKKAVHLKAGQMPFGRNAAGIELGMNSTKVYRIVKLLESLGNIKMKSNNKFSIITIVKWADFQVGASETEQQTNSKRTTNEQQENNKRTHKKNNKENKEEKEIDPAFAQNKKWDGTSGRTGF